MRMDSSIASKWVQRKLNPSPKLDSSDESDNYFDGEQNTMTIEVPMDDRSHNTLIQSLKSAMKTKRKRFAKDDEDHEILDARGKLVFTEEAKSGDALLDLFDSKEDSVVKEVKSSRNQPKKKKVKGEMEKSLSLTTSLEKPAVKRIQREILYNNTSKEVSKWNSVVYNNRVADQLVFPLPDSQTLSKRDARNIKEDTFVPMTPLEVEIANRFHGAAYVEQQRISILGKKDGTDDGETYVRTVEEALERHHELARLRALQSYQMAKAKRQGKIKSKKYHRLQRREKIRKQMKEFEELQKTDPDAALLKLEELDRARVEERMSLKHRNTSKWAKAQSVRAKYNRESRAELSEQLKISRELTKKIAESSEESDPDAADLELPPLVKSVFDNPWCLSEMKDSDNVNMYYTGYKRFWDEVNTRKERERKRQERDEERQLLETEALSEKQNKTAPSVSVEEEDVPLPVAANKNKKKCTTKSRSKALSIKATPLVALAELPKELSVDDLDELLHKANQKLKEKMSHAVKQAKIKRQAKAVEPKTSAEKQYHQDGDAEEVKDLVVDDDEINFEGGTEVGQAAEPRHTSASTISHEASKSKPPPQKIIDPSHFLEIRKSTKFDMKASSEMDSDAEILPNDDSENEEREHVKMIAEAFDDAELLGDFESRKVAEVEGGKPKEINLVLPGWGEWGGKDCQPSKKKQRKFIKKLPPLRPRKDRAMPHVILNESANVKLREHQVKELPFPFTRVADYEKMVRAPIGRTWMPEGAMKALIAPKVITRLGQVIQPISDDVLVKRADRRNQSKGLKLMK